MATILLVRHGQASWGADDYDVLSPMGWEQSRLLGESLLARGLSVDSMVHGTMRRHVETAEALREAAPETFTSLVRADAAWNEFDHGSALDRHPQPFGDREPTRREFGRWFEGALSRWYSGEHDDDYPEPFSAFVARIEKAATHLINELEPDQCAVVVTSGGVIAWLAVRLLRGDFEIDVRPQPTDVDKDVWRRVNSTLVNTGVTKVALRTTRSKLLTLNEHCHLEQRAATVI